MKEIKSPGTNDKNKENQGIYFLDTYAIFEIIEGNPKYKKYQESKIITSVFNLAELNYNLKKEVSKKKADEYTSDYYKFSVEVTLNDIKKAMDLKTKHKKLSIPDAVGYIVAKRYGVKFLTGDEDFKNFDNVEFVKK